MLNRLYDNWVYGGFLMALILLGLWPLLSQSLTWPGALILLSISVYAIHQYEEHDADRFRLFLNVLMAKRGPGLSKADVFYINVVLVWALLALALWMTEKWGAGWALISAFLLLVNGAAHVVQALVMKASNPGLWTAIFLFMPLATYEIMVVWPAQQISQLIVSLVVVLAAHAMIILRARRTAN